ncbi:MAG: RNA polymerase sigma factor [Alphaproteobacteria bacterium]|jgi:RNA polymerase sigma-70 factor (ECF subfamily)|nr:RNA polymerase sigma factor [Alphaproteobacteria bacterium]MDP7221950.1 RNA polymerase sigma factor [Alphaproteobacteria bacterium]
MKQSQHERREINWMIAREIPALRRYAQTLLRGRGDKDDLVQDTLERAIKKSHTWRREGSIRSWLYRVQYTVFLNRYRKQANLKEVTAKDMNENPVMSVKATQGAELECQRVLKALENLKPRHSEVLLLIAVEGFSYDQAAQIMDVPVGTVRSRLARAREDLRAEMQHTALHDKDTQTPLRTTSS